MAIVSAGYDGTVDERQFADMFDRYSVVGRDDFEATTVAGDRIVSIADGTALGPGTIDVATSIPPIQFATATGTRWDLVVLRRDWQPPGGETTIRIIQGGPTRGIPSRSKTPGIVDDQPLYLQQVNGTILGERVDLRCWAGPGGLEVRDDLARVGYLALPGAQVKVGGRLWFYESDSNGQYAWRAHSLGGTQVFSASEWMNGAIPYSTTSNGNLVTVARISIPDPGFPYHLSAQAIIESNPPVSGTRWDARLECPGQPRLALSRGDAAAPWYDLNGFTSTAISGSSHVDLVLARLAGTAPFGISELNRMFRVMQHPA